MAAPVLESSTLETNAAATSHAVTAPTGIGAGELLVLVAFFDSDPGTFAAPSGWTGHAAETYGGDGNYMAHAYKIADVADESAGDFTYSTTNSVTSGDVLLRVSGGPNALDVSLYEAVGNFQVLPSFGLNASSSSGFPRVRRDGNVNATLWVQLEWCPFSAWATYDAGDNAVGRLTYGGGEVQVAYQEPEIVYAGDEMSRSTVSDGSEWFLFTLVRINAAGLHPELHADDARDNYRRRPAAVRRFHPRRTQPEGLPLPDAPDTDPEDVAAAIAGSTLRPRVLLRPRRDPHEGRIDRPDDEAAGADEFAAAVAATTAPVRRVVRALRPRRREAEWEADEYLDALTVAPSWQTEPRRPRVRVRRFRDRLTDRPGEPIPDPPDSCPGMLAVQPGILCALVDAALDAGAFGTAESAILCSVTPAATCAVKPKSC